jgi:hypothetical protein
MADSSKGVNYLIMAKKTSSRTNFLKFWADHPNYTALVHTVLGVGLGLLAQTFIVDGYTNMLGWVLVFLGVIGHMYPFAA